MPKPAPPSVPPAEELIERIERFLERAHEPVLMEPGAELVEVSAGRYALTPSPPGVRLEAWDQESNYHRRVLGVKECGDGRLELVVERFGGKRAKAVLADRARSACQGIGRRARRMVFAERLRDFLCRQFPGWRIGGLTAHGDPENHLSQVYPRAMVVKGQRAWAVIAAPPGDAADRLLTCGLIWHNYLRFRERRLFVEGLALLLPREQIAATCLRLPWLNKRAVRVAVFAYGEDGWEHEVEEAHGNYETALQPASRQEPSAGGIWRRNAGGPEWWLEQAVRSDPAAIDGRLRQEPVYGQVPVLAGVERGIIDLLACSHQGRLTVIELKAAADPHLPVQALDYWMRVAGHALCGEFGSAGYFPGVTLTAEPPRLILAAPSFEFHPTTESVLGYFDPAIEVERVGLAVEWQKRIRVSFRLQGTRRPG
ncbi:MAG: hypothetical protein IT163_06195 [Bryobacterales bacterium]|nr:hypothetical protein [Bryobacterales bacterium]